jgi:hypothetical protein
MQPDAPPQFELVERDERRLPARLAAAIPYHGAYELQARWLTDPYTGLRNAAWAVRNARVGNDLNPLALRLVLAEATGLLEKGETTWDVLEAFAELLLRP